MSVCKRLFRRNVSIQRYFITVNVWHTELPIVLYLTVLALVSLVLPKVLVLVFFVLMILVVDFFALMGKVKICSVPKLC